MFLIDLFSTLCVYFAWHTGQKEAFPVVAAFALLFMVAWRLAAVCGLLVYLAVRNDRLERQLAKQSAA